MPIFPGLVTHNNPNEAIIDVTGNQVKGFGVFASISGAAPNRNSLSESVRSEGYVAIVKDVDKIYIYTSSSIAVADWQNAANWVEIGSGGGSYTLPIATASVLGGIKVGANLSIDAVTGVLSATDTNTTYSAGSGITLSGTTFSHTDTSSQASSTNTGRTYIQSIGLDTYGHVTSLSTATETVTSNTYTAGNGLTLSTNEFNVGGTANRITVTADAVDIASTYVGQISITTLGTITSGTWNAGSISNDYITSVAGTKVTGNISGNATNVTGTVAIANGGTGATTDVGARSNLGLVIGTNVQAYDADLAAIAALAGTSGLLRKTAADTWSLDTATYITGNQTISLSGDVTGSGTTAITTALSNTGVSAGTYRSVTVDTKGRVTAGTNPTTISGYGITDFYSQVISGFIVGANTAITNTDTLETAIEKLQGQVNARISGNQTITITGDVDGSGTTSIELTLDNTGVAAGTYNNSLTDITPFTVDSKGRITSTGTAVTIKPAFSSITSRPTTLSGYGITDAQPLDADLTAISGLTGTGILKRTAADTWSLDTTTYANDNAVVKSVNSITPISGAVTLYGTSIARSSSNIQTINAGLVAAENNISTNSQDIAAIQVAIAPISKDQTKSRFGFSQTSAAIETTETTGSFFRGSTGYFFSQASPGTVEVKVLDDSVTPVQRTVIYGEGRIGAAVVGIHNTTPSYPLDITGNTRVTGNIIVTGTVDGVDISELKNTVDNITVGGTEEIELFSYFIS